MQSPVSYTYLFITLLALNACLPEDDPVRPHDPGPQNIGRVEMGSDYAQRVYFDLASSSVVYSSIVDSWDIAFDCRPAGILLRLNTGKVMRAADMGPLDFADLNDTSGAAWRYDTPDGHPDSTAIGLWADTSAAPPVSLGHLYIIDLGYNLKGRHQGFVKMRIAALPAGSYLVEHARLAGSASLRDTVAKQAEYNYIGFNFTTRRPVVFEARRDEWDLVFTKYTHLFYDPEFTAYSVTGALSNPNGVMAARDSLRDYDAITFETARTLVMQAGWNLIGYDWKYYSLTEGSYSIVPGMYYLIRDTEGYFYKLRFIDFYNNSGDKGYPAFEFRRL